MNQPDPNVRACQGWSVGNVLLIGALGLALYLPRLGVEILRSPLEVKYALVARQMLEGSPLLVPHVFGQLYPDKPPLYFWATAGLGWLAGGIDEVIARLPAAVAAVAGLLLVYRLGADLFGAGSGIAAAFCLATSNLFFWYARQGHPDQFLTTFVIFAYLGLWRSINLGSHRAGWTLLAYVAMGLGVLSKGLLGFLLPLLGAGTYLALTRPLRVVPAGLHLRLGIPAFLVVVLTWYGPAVAQTGSGYVYDTLIYHHLIRYTRAWVHRETWYYYLGQFPAQFFPWVLFLPGAAVLGWRLDGQRRPDPSQGVGTVEPCGRPAVPGLRPILFPLAWFVSGFALFTLSTSKRGAYLLPLYPAAALLVGWLWSWTIRTGARSRWVAIPLTGLSAGAATLAFILAIIPRHLITAHIGPGSRADMLIPATPRQLIAVITLLLAGAIGVAWAWYRARPAQVFGLLVAFQALILVAAGIVRAPQYEARLPVRALAARVEAVVPRGQPVLITLNHNNLLAAFYLGRPVTLAGTEDLTAPRRDAAELRYALVDASAPVVGQPRVHLLEETWLGADRVVLVRLDPTPP